MFATLRRWPRGTTIGGAVGAVTDLNRPVAAGPFPTEKRVVGRGEFRGLEFVHVQTRSTINRLPPSTPMRFRHTINADRGCSHACTYRFARPTHAYLDLNPSTDFDRVIVVKVNTVERLRAELAPKRWAGDPVAMGTNTDPYQRAEGKYHLTCGIVEVLAAQRNPFSILTKSTLILRDRDLLADAARRTDVSLCFSVGTLDEDVWRLTEPGTPPRRDASARWPASTRLGSAPACSSAPSSRAGPTRPPSWTPSSEARSTPEPRRSRRCCSTFDPGSASTTSRRSGSIGLTSSPTTNVSTRAAPTPPGRIGTGSAPSSGTSRPVTVATTRRRPRSHRAGSAARNLRP
jgi:hypothetical protein